MQYKEKKAYFSKVLGELIKEIRTSKGNDSLTKFSNEYDLQKSSLSRIEKGFYSIELITAWRIVEALGISFSEFASMLEKKLGKDFKFIDE